VAEALVDLPERGCRVPRPIAAGSGSWTYSGWTAWTLVEGSHDFTRWPEVLEVCEAFHVALEALERPSFIDSRTHQWAIGDRMAWGEEPLAVRNDALRPLLDQLTAHLRPVTGTSQVVHGDLPGNVLFADPSAPAVIDFAPYWRPPAFALAAVVVDAIAWHSASESLVERVANVEQIEQCLARAAIYRLVAADRATSDPTVIRANAVCYGRVAELVGALTGDR